MTLTSLTLGCLKKMSVIGDSIILVALGIVVLGLISRESEISDAVRLENSSENALAAFAWLSLSVSTESCEAAEMLAKSKAVPYLSHSLLSIFPCIPC